MAARGAGALSAAGPGSVATPRQRYGRPSEDRDTGGGTTHYPVTQACRTDKSACRIKHGFPTERQSSRRYRSGVSHCGAAQRIEQGRVQGVEGAAGDFLRCRPDLGQVRHHGRAAGAALDDVLVVGPVRRLAAVVVEDPVDQRDTAQPAEVALAPALRLAAPAGIGSGLGPMGCCRPPSSRRTRTRRGFPVPRGPALTRRADTPRTRNGRAACR